MAETNELQIEDGTKKKGGGMMPLIAALVLVTLIGGGGGAAMGVMLGGGLSGEEATDKAETASDDTKAETGGEHDTAEAGLGEGGEDSIAEIAEEEEKPLRVVALKPVLTNLSNPSTSWIRIEASVIVKDDAETDPDILAAEIEADTLAFARSLQIAQIEGTRGLLHLRDDLRERAKLRSPAVVDYLIQAMVVE
ncbi:flagellar protein [Fulvimarina pelagi HTCC2506]|uniref:Flagellar protein FliL n=2 Tax=Fulvimarina pelagi TaxID=217511 RepID=Q0G1E5_9HYPH|nr:flagellar basal body-associated FliL family protein [Fulvimarina pelagi]EAU41136.1 flagellar protein [Fulvimarina pelagi HTCC2506]BAT30849.1 flagellar protein [Fulvimarina pelagi]